MALVINTNVPAINAQRNLGINNSQLGKSLERLSSGLRINRAADDAAGLAIATKFQGQVRGLGQAVRNVNNAISLVQTAEAGITTLTNILQRLRELAVQSSSDDNTSTDRSMLTSEADNLIAEFTRVSSTSEFNTMTLLDGSFSGKYFQVGANYAQLLTFQIGDARGKALGGRAEFSGDVADGITTAADANFGGGEFKVNGYDVSATSSTDDQYSVIDLSSAVITGITAVKLMSLAGLSDVTSATSNMLNTASFGLSFNLNINGVSISLVYTFAASTFKTASGVASALISLATITGTAITGASLANDIVTAINNNASLVALNIAARTTNGGSAWVLEGTKGVNVTTLLSMNVLLSGMTHTLASTEVSLVGVGSLMSGVTSVIGDGNILTASVTAYNGESSAVAKAVAINSVKFHSQVTATAKANVVTGSSAITAATINSGDIYINGVNIGAVTLANNDSTGALVAAINNKTNDTGVIASKDASNKLVLTAADGRNITVTADTTAKAGNLLGATSVTNNFTGTSGVFRSTVQLNSEQNISLTGTLADLYATSATTTWTKTSDTTKSQATDVATYNVNLLEIDTQANAQAAMLTIDAAFNDVNLLRSQIGAIQNRLEFTVANLESASENFSASESRIRDADFASETGKLTRNQILVQAGTAMLAQANQLSQLALQLLK